MTIAQKQVELLIKDISLKNPNKECCGIITNDKVIECKNISAQKSRHFAIHPNEIRNKDIKAYFHSHPKGYRGFSNADKMISDKINLPAFLYEIESDKHYSYFPSGKDVPLIGRPFVYTIFDCIELTKDYYKQNLNIEIPFKTQEYLNLHKNVDPDDFINSINNLNYSTFIIDYFLSANFEISNDLRKNDVIITKMSSIVPSHCSVYIGDGKILNQYTNKPSQVKDLKRTIKNLKRSNFVYKIVRWKR